MSRRRSSQPVKPMQPVEACQFLQKIGIPTPVFIDFEFNRSSHQNVNLVSCSIWYPLHSDRPVEYWLHNRPDQVVALSEIIRRMHAAGAWFIGYAIAAEARSVIALDVDPHELRWIDLYAEWCQLTYNNNQCEYGTYYTKTGFMRVSTPPFFDKDKNKGRDNNHVGRGMVDVTAQLFGIFIDSARKLEMRDLIIEDRPNYTPAEQSDITAYCSDDVKYLPAMAAEIVLRLHQATGLPLDKIPGIQARRGCYSVSIGKMECEGFPIKTDKIWNLRRNFDLVEDTLISDLVENYYPFYLREKKRLSDLRGRWTDKYENFLEFVTKNDLLKAWPRTVNKETKLQTTLLSREDKVLAEYEGVREIRQYRQVKKQVLQLRWFKAPNEEKKEREGDFFDSVGPDNRLRTFLGPFGTQTGRNAPKASRFILAMSSWLRCLIEPPPGWVIIGIDYASQEFAIAAIMSGDKNMIEAYLSGDPYLYFAKKAGAVPPDADPKGCKDPARMIARFLPLGTDIPHGVPPDLFAALPPEAVAILEAYKRHKFQRGLFKATTLGLQYGMGAAKLAVKLSSDMGVKFTQDEAQRLIDMHKKVYAVFWIWAERIGMEYDKKGVLILWDGWSLLGDNDNMLSVKNFPVQGTGGVIMREAVRLAHTAGVRILSPLHDALYAIAREDEAEQQADLLAGCMTQAVKNVIGDNLEIRLDIDFHRHGETWIEEKGERFYKLLHRYLARMETASDRLTALKNGIFGGVV